MKRLSRLLLQKSQEAFVLGVEVFNKPTIKYRLEGFAFFFVNAWELLLKARIIEITGKTQSVFRKPKKGRFTSGQESISVDEALRVVFPDPKVSVRRNIEAVSDLRNAATHLVVAELEPVYVGLFQAGVLNYVRALHDWFGENITDKITPGMLSLVFDLHDIEPLAIKKRYGKEVLQFIERQRALVQQGDMTDTHFCIPVDYRLVLTKKVSDADLMLTQGSLANHSAMVVQVPKDLEATHPYLRSDVIKKVQERLGEGVRFNTHDFQVVVFKERVQEQNNQYHYYLTRPEAHKYSDSFVDRICELIRSNPRYLDTAREAYAKRKRPKLRDRGLRPTVKVTHQ